MGETYTRLPGSFRNLSKDKRGIFKRLQGGYVVVTTILPGKGRGVGKQRK